MKTKEDVVLAAVRAFASLLKQIGRAAGPLLPLGDSLHASAPGAHAGVHRQIKRQGTGMYPAHAGGQLNAC
jgi:hypothetical protein